MNWQPWKTLPADWRHVHAWLPQAGARFGCRVQTATRLGDRSVGDGVAYVIGGTFSFDLPADHRPTHWAPIEAGPDEPWDIVPWLREGEDRGGVYVAEVISIEGITFDHAGISYDDMHVVAQMVADRLDVGDQRSDLITDSIRDLGYSDTGCEDGEFRIIWEKTHAY